MAFHPMRFLPWLVAMLIIAGVCWRFPLFHVVSLKQVQQERVAATFNPSEFAEKFWNERLLKSLDQAVKADVLLPEIRNNAAEARKKYSRSVGVSESYTYFISGTGRVVAVNEDEISLAVTSTTNETDVVLQTGLLFSNAVRDGTGLIHVSDYPNSQDFNAISEALNRIIEERVQPRLRAAAKTGTSVSFVGCAEVNDEAVDLKPLKVVPISTTIE